MGGPQHRPQSTIVLIIGTPKKVPLTWETTIYILCSLLLLVLKTSSLLVPVILSAAVFAAMMDSSITVGSMDHDNGPIIYDLTHARHIPGRPLQALTQVRSYPSS